MAKIKTLILPLLFLTIVVGIFFYKTFTRGLLPFPGDLLVGEYKPWQTFSYGGYLPGSVPNKAQYPDTLRQLYPWKTLTTALLKKYQLPLWNPYNFSGAPLAANFQSAVFYPLNIFYFIFPQVWAWTILVILQPLLAAVFTFLYCRKIGAGRWGAGLAANAYGFSAFMLVWLQYNTIGQVILWLPLTLLAIEHLSEKATVFWSLTYIFSLVVALFAGHPQIFSYIFLFALIYSWHRQHLSRKALFLYFLSLISLGIGAVQLIPGAELIALSARSPHPYSTIMQKILIQPWQLLMLLIPDFFGNPANRNYWLSDTYIGKAISIGIVPLLFLVQAWKTPQKSLINFYGKVAVITLLLISVNPLSAFVYRLPLPLISTSGPTLLAFLFCFSLAILAGIGLDSWLKQKQRWSDYFSTVAPLTLIFLTTWIVVLLLPKTVSFLPWVKFLKISLRNLILPSFTLISAVFLLWLGWKKPQAKKMLVFLLLTLNLGEFWLFFHKFNPFVPSTFVFPSHPVFDFLKREAGIDRFWGYGHAAVDANFATQYGLFSPDGYDPLYPKWYGELIQASRDGKIHIQFNDQTRSDAFITRGFGETDLAQNSYRLRLLDVLGVKYILDRIENNSTEKTFPPTHFKLVTAIDGWRVFENLKAAPRIFLASNYLVYNNLVDFEKAFFAPDFNYTNTILLEKPLNMPLVENTTSETWVKVINYEPNIITLQAKSNGNLLYLSDVYYPGWKAFIDNQKAEIYKANYAFRAIYLPPGSHEVRFVFDPESLGLGFIISIGSIITMLLSLRRVLIWVNKNENF